ncbi:MAG: cytochrome c oxidase subunit 3 [Bryobacteraceae bacterium]
MGQRRQRHAGAKMFYCFYFSAVTGMHALHMVMNAPLLYFMNQARKNTYHPQYCAPAKLMGLYWHSPVDIVWIFLFPLLYLLGLHLGHH